jgi:hypothetical protein
MSGEQPDVGTKLALSRHQVAILKKSRKESQMLQLNVTDLLDVSDEDLVRRIEEASGVVQMTITVADLYQANSKTELAQNWLKVWYTAERLAEHARSATCIVSEAELGVGNLVFTIAADDPFALAADLIGFAVVYGGDDLEASALVHDEAEDWLRNRGDSPAWFSGLEQNYRDDAALAAELEGYCPGGNMGPGD